MRQRARPQEGHKRTSKGAVGVQAQHRKVRMLLLLDARPHTGTVQPGSPGPRSPATPAEGGPKMARRVPPRSDTAQYDTRGTTSQRRC